CTHTSIPNKGVLPSINGESWFGVLITSSSPLFRTNQAHPEPKRVLAAVSNSSLNLSKLPNVPLILSANSPVGSPPPFGDNTFQKRLWLACPPPLFRTAVRMFSGTASKSEIKSTKDLFCSSALPSNAPFKFVT